VPGAQLGATPGAATRPAPAAGTAPLVGQTLDGPIVDPQAAVSADLTAAVDPGGLRREVFGFLPYWELTDASTTLDWEALDDRLLRGRCGRQRQPGTHGQGD
jgi:hypothetical protein